MKLHIGCGKRYLPGYVHVDVTKHDHVDVVCDISKLDEMFETESVDEIYASHVLEHFPRNKILSVLTTITKVLKVGGTLRLAVPDFDAVVTRYNMTENLPELMGLLYGGQTDEFNYHYVTFNYKVLSDMLEMVGCVNCQRYDAHEFLPEGFDDYSKAYLPHFDRNGMLMSLNIIAYKGIKKLNPN